jgi:hypothetical protein
MNIPIHLISLSISFIILYLSYKISTNQDKLTNKVGFDYGSKGYLCGTCEDGKTKLVTSPTGTYFTKFIFADYGKPGTCPSTDVGPENLPLKSSNCTLPNTLPNSPFTYLSDNIHGKTTIVVSATPDFFGINLTCGSFFTYVLEYTYVY